MIYNLGPVARRVYDSLRGRFAPGALAAGDRLPSCVALAAEFGVAPLTVRQVLARLEEEGRVSRQRGRGTFVCAPDAPAVLVVDDEPVVRQVLTAFVEQGGARAVTAGGPAEALAVLEQEPQVSLILSDLRMPAAADGVEFIRTARRRWPAVPFAAVTGFSGDLDGLFDTPEWPVLVLTKPVRLAHILDVLRLLSGPKPGDERGREGAVA